MGPLGAFAVGAAAIILLGCTAVLLADVAERRWPEVWQRIRGLWGRCP